MKYATIGTSWITESFIAAAGLTNKWQLHAVYSRDAQKGEAFRKKHGATHLYTSLDDLSADTTVETVYIASPNALHYTQSRQMLAAGKNVFCEKPATVTEAQYKELLELANEKGVCYAEAIMSLHVPAIAVIRSALPALGNISSAHLNYAQLSSKYPAFLAGETPNIYNPALCAGCLMDLGVYNLYLAAALFGEPNRILSSSHFLRTGADGFGTAVLSYPNMQLTLTYSKIGQGFQDSEIIGDRATLRIASVSQLTGVRLQTKVSEDLLIADSIDRSTIMGGEAVFFYDCIRKKDKMEASYQYAQQTALIVRRMCDTIRKQNGFPF